jgi:hypothetical protein
VRAPIERRVLGRHTIARVIDGHEAFVVSTREGVRVYYSYELEMLCRIVFLCWSNEELRPGQDVIIDKSAESIEGSTLYAFSVEKNSK